jgi:hypothetical protein
VLTYADQRPTHIDALTAVQWSDKWAKSIWAKSNRHFSRKWGRSPPLLCEETTSSDCTVATGRAGQVDAFGATYARVAALYPRPMPWGSSDDGTQIEILRQCRTIPVIRCRTKAATTTALCRTASPDLIRPSTQEHCSLDVEQAVQAGSKGEQRGAKSDQVQMDVTLYSGRVPSFTVVRRVC